MGLERVGGDPGVIAPDLGQQFLARHGLGPGAIEVFQDIGFLLRQADLAALRRRQGLGCRAELIGADTEDGVLGLFVTAQMGADPGQKYGKAERLGDVVIGPGVEAQNRI